MVFSWFFQGAIGPLDAGVGWHHEIAGRFAPLISVSQCPRFQPFQPQTVQLMALMGILGGTSQFFKWVAKIDGLLWFT